MNDNKLDSIADAPAIAFCGCSDAFLRGVRDQNVLVVKRQWRETVKT